MNNLFNVIYASIVLLVFPCTQFLTAKEAPYDLEFDFIQKVIAYDDANIYPKEFWSLREDYLEQRKQNDTEVGSASLDKDDSEESDQQSNGLFDLALAIQDISKAQNEFMELLPQDHRDVYKARLDQLIEISETALLMKEDLWFEDYVNKLLKHIIGIRAAGISEKLPKFLWNPRINIEITEKNFEDVAALASSAYDENFRHFGILRSYLPEGDAEEKWLQPSPYQSIIWDLRQYMINEKANENFIKQVAHESKHNINNPLPKAVKGFLKNQKEPISSYYSGSKFSYPPSNKNSRAVIIWHAFTQEILKNTQFRHQNREKKTVRVMRTLRISPPKREKEKYTMPQGILDSVGVFFPFSYFDTITVFEVPNHRILGVFFMEKAAGFGTSGKVEKSGLFADDAENEFLAMLEGIPFEIVSWENLDLNGDPEFDSYALNSYYQNKLSLIDDAYAKDNLNVMLAKASSLGDFDAALLFVELGADVNFKDKHGLTSLNYAYEKGDISIVSLFLDKGADVNTKDLGGEALIFNAIVKGDMAFLSLLLDKGADVNTKTLFGKTPLFSAVAKGDRTIVSLFLDKGADINVQDSWGNTPLHFAALKGHIDIVSLLLDKGADINVQNSSGNTPLHFTALKGHIDIVGLLLEKGAAVNAKDNIGNTPLDVAKINGYGKIVHLIEEEMKLYLQ